MLVISFNYIFKFKVMEKHKQLAELIDTLALSSIQKIQFALLLGEQDIESVTDLDSLKNLVKKHGFVEKIRIKDDYLH